MTVHGGARKAANRQVSGYSVTFRPLRVRGGCTGCTQNREMPGQVVHGAVHGWCAPHVHVSPSPFIGEGNVPRRGAAEIFGDTTKSGDPRRQPLLGSTAGNRTRYINPSDLRKYWFRLRETTRKYAK